MITYQDFYNKGIEAKLNGHLQESAALHIKALEIYPNWELPEAWHNAGAALLRIGKQNEAQPYLEKALHHYQVRIEFEEKVAYHKFWKACAYALLENEAECVESLREAVELDSSYAEEAIQEEDFENYWENASFLNVIQPILDKLYAKRFKGDALGLKDLNQKQLENLNLFRSLIESLALGPDDMKDLFDTGMKISPQASFEFCEHPEYCFRWSLHLDTHLLFFEMIHRKHQFDLKTFRLYLDEENPNLEAILKGFKASIKQINAQNWTDLIRILLPYSKELLFEMPDGNKVKVS